LLDSLRSPLGLTLLYYDFNSANKRTVEGIGIQIGFHDRS
jgi:hypothetical protein